MNKPRRKTLKELSNQLSDVRDTLEMVKDEEEEYRDNIPENLQGSEKYEKTDAYCDSLYEDVSNLEEAIEQIQSTIE